MSRNISEASRTDHALCNAWLPLLRVFIQIAIEIGIEIDWADVIDLQ
jgi:hypothetical protein